MSNALKKVNDYIKVLKKRHPGAKHSTLQKQAGKAYRAGTIPKARKKAAAKPRKRKVSKVGARYKVYHEVKKVGKARKKRAARKRAAPKRTKSRARVRVVHRTVTRTRRVGGMGKSIMPLVAVAGLGLVAYMLLKPKTSGATAPPLILTGNATRDNSAQNILAYAQAASLGASAIASLINSLNSMSDAAVVQAAAQPDLSINTLLAVPTGGPSINLGV